jgi:hypothetical protein
MFSRVSGTSEVIALQLENTVVAALLSWDAKFDSNVHLKL